LMACISKANKRASIFLSSTKISSRGMYIRIGALA